VTSQKLLIYSQQVYGQLLRLPPWPSHRQGLVRQSVPHHGDRVRGPRSRIFLAFVSELLRAK
jgi:hypothetical protein